MKLVLRIDREVGGYAVFKSEDDLKKCLQEQDCANSTYSDEEYYKHNGHVSLEDFCDLYTYSFIKLTEEQIEEALGDYAEKHKLKDNWGEEAWNMIKK